MIFTNFQNLFAREEAHYALIVYIYFMSEIRIATNFNIDVEFTSPPFYRRLAAWMIDLFLEVFYLIMAIRYLNSIRVSNFDESYNIWAIGLALMVPFLVYHVVCEITMNGQSFGKKLIGIRVISENGGRPSISQYVIRWLIRTSDVTLLIMIIMAASGAFSRVNAVWGMGMVLGLLLLDVILVNTRKQQRLGDILAGTILINTRQKEDINDTIFQEVSDTYVPSFPQVMQLSDRDINSLKGILDTARKRHDFNLAELASEKIKAHLNIYTTLSPFDFLEVLLKDYNYLSAN
jgi:uncharacterized RDD family membrane protein YckC